MRGLVLVCGLAACASDAAQTDLFSGDGKDDSSMSSAAKKRESAVAAKLEAARGDDAAVRALIESMPKGADLHMHLSGAAATETLISLGIGDHDCVSTTYTAESCTVGGSALSSASKTQVIAAWSMQGSQTAPVSTRHDHFFSTFGKVGFITRLHTADMIADVRRTAAAEHAQYVELMVGLGQGTGGKLAEQIMPPAGPWNATEFANAAKLIRSDPTIAATIARNRSQLNTWESDVEQELGCGTSHAEAACDVEVRYLVQGVRIASRESVFGQFVYGFMLAAADPRVVGVELVQAEDDPKSLRNYHDQMVGIGWIVQDTAAHGQHTPISLHAGELTPAFASSTDLSFHVHEAVEIAGAQRIGHATDVLGEKDSSSLVQEMAAKHIAVEACLTSNQQLLDVEGDAHPASALLHAGVPVAFATDDQGILRVDLNDEFVRAFETQGLDYRGLKRAIHASMSSTFLPGARLSTVTACQKSLYDETLHATCATALQSNEHAAAEWQLETELDAWETSILK